MQYIYWEIIEDGTYDSNDNDDDVDDMYLDPYADYQQ